MIACRACGDGERWELGARFRVRAAPGGPRPGRAADRGYGDSGGPHLFAGTDLLASMSLYIDPPCRAYLSTQRLDTDAARSFLARFVTLP